MNFGLSGWSDWFQEQGKYALFIATIVLSIIFGFKRQWLGLLGALVGLAIIGIFILDPNVITHVSEFVSQKFGLTGSETPAVKKK